MIDLKPGQRTPTSALTSNSVLRISLDLDGRAGLDIDYACFGLDSNGKLSDDRYMIFYNQPASPCGSITQSNDASHNTVFDIDLNRVPATIDKLIFTASVDGPNSLQKLGASAIRFQSMGNDTAQCKFNGEQFIQERAVMLTELYRKNGEWRAAITMQGFNEGLDALVRHFGGSVDDASVPAPVVAPATISLEKKVEKSAPALVSLAKKAQVSLDKFNLGTVKARVGLVLDASGSMDGQYKRGDVQELINRLLPLAVHFDDDGELDTWAFGEKTAQLNSVSMDNYEHFIDDDNGGWKKWKLGSRVNCEVSAMKAVIDYYAKSQDTTPIYIIFISDGGVHENRKIEKMVRDAASLPIFWQFVGMGGHGYGILEKLDTMTGRVVDNCNFFAIDDLRRVSEDDLYDRLMAEFPDWLKEAKSKGIIQ